MFRKFVARLVAIVAVSLMTLGLFANTAKADVVPGFFSGAEDGGYYNTDRDVSYPTSYGSVIIFSPSEYSRDSIYYTWPTSSPYSLHLSTEGHYYLLVQGSDTADPEASPMYELSFDIDKTAPVVTTNITEGQSSTEPVTVTFTVSGGTITSAKIDGADVSAGVQVSAVGSHQLVVIADDSHGNVTTKTVNFSIVAPVVDTVTSPTSTSVSTQTVLAKVKKAVKATPAVAAEPAQAAADASQVKATSDVAEGEGLAPWAIRLIGIGGFAILFVVGWIVARASHNKQYKSNKLKVASSKKSGSKKSVTKNKTKKTAKKTSRRKK